MRTVCLMEVNRDAEAAKLLQEALAESPKDPYVLVTQASYLAKSGRIPEAKAILKMPELSNVPIKNLLAGDMCISRRTSVVRKLRTHKFTIKIKEMSAPCTDLHGCRCATETQRQLTTMCAPV